MLYVSYGFVPKAFKPFLKKRVHDYTLYEAENQLKAYQTSQTSSFFEMPKLEIKQIKAGRNESLLTLDLKSNEMQADTFSLESYLEEYFLSNYMDFSDFEEKIYFVSTEFKILLMSSGQKIFCSLVLNLLSVIKNNSLVLIDEPETALHPNLEIDFMKILKSEH